ncbi:hypothetical protein PRZ48_001289 [Zasmidium cellare]|uniref:Uncharacterized protein n=1 Tax=Zasmidium cellare TaxID=395010 RepID=A0ABR0F1T6_ZASCE|nr:hypothetical protein PRZ48_001289 [Zasmidium cellare]
MVDFSEREKELMALAWQCFEEEPKIQYAKLAEMAGMTNAGSASNAWRNIKKKLTAIAAGNGDADGAGTPKAKATPKRKKKAADSDDAEETPAKKTKATPKKKSKKAAAEEEDDDDEEAAKLKSEASESDELS